MPRANRYFLPDHVWHIIIYGSDQHNFPALYGSDQRNPLWNKKLLVKYGCNSFLKYQFWYRNHASKHNLEFRLCLNVAFRGEKQCFKLCYHQLFLAYFNNFWKLGRSDPVITVIPEMNTFHKKITIGQRTIISNIRVNCSLFWFIPLMICMTIE